MWEEMSDVEEGIERRKRVREGEGEMKRRWIAGLLKEYDGRERTCSMHLARHVGIVARQVGPTHGGRLGRSMNCQGWTISGDEMEEERGGGREGMTMTISDTGDCGEWGRRTGGKVVSSWREEDEEDK